MKGKWGRAGKALDRYTWYQRYDGGFFSGLVYYK